RASDVAGPRAREAGARGEGEAEAAHGGAAHRARHGVGMGAVVGERRYIARGAGEPGDDQEILMPADQRRNRLAPVEHEPRHGGSGGGYGTARGGMLFHRVLLRSASRRAAFA